MFNETMFRLKVNMMCGSGPGPGGTQADFDAINADIGIPGDPGGGFGMDSSSNATSGDHLGFSGQSNATGQGENFGGSGGSGGNVGPGIGPGGASATGEVGVPSVGFGAGNEGGDQGASPGDADFAGITSDINAVLNPSTQTNFNAIQNDFSAINSEISAALEGASSLPTSKQNQFAAFMQSAMTTVAKLGITSLASLIGLPMFGLLSEAASSFGLNADSFNAALSNMFDGMSVSDAVGSMSSVDFGGEGATGGGPATSGTVDSPDSDITGGSGGGGDSVANNDPLSYDFWNNFVDEWMGKNGKSAKTMYSEDDAFKKGKVEPAIGKYQAALADLTNQAQTGTGSYTPTTFGMGNFRSSFVPKSGLMTADNLKDYAKEGLTSELALTDVMQPNKGSMDYLSALQELAKFDKEAQLRKYGIDMGYNTAIDSIQEGQEDKGSWLDIVKDVVQIGDTVGDAWSKYF